MTPALRKQLAALAANVAVKNGLPVDKVMRLLEPPPQQGPGQEVPPVSPRKYVEPLHTCAFTPEAIRTSLDQDAAYTELIRNAGNLSRSLWSAVATPGHRRDRLEQLQKLHTALLAVALALAAARGYKRCGQVAFHSVGELLRHQLDLSLGSYYHYLKDLKRLGLIDYRGHFSSRSVAGRSVVRADGTIFALSFNTDHQARLGIGDYGGHRDLDADIREGRTVWNFLRNLERSLSCSTTQLQLEPLIMWALRPGNLTETPLALTFPSTAPLLELLLDVPGADSSARAEAVGRAARATCAALGDGHSFEFWCKVQWQLLRSPTPAQNFSALFLTLQRAVTDGREGFARNAAALAVRRLRRRLIPPASG